MIDDATKNRILDTAQILDVVSDFVTLRRRGANYIGLCPFHNERTPSFNVSPARGIFKCFGCGKSGDVARFLMEHEQMSFPETLRWLAAKYGIPIEERQLTDEERMAQNHRESLFIINEFTRNWCQDQLFNTPGGQAIGLAYFRSRGFRDDIIRKFQLGYCPEGRDTMCREAMAKGYKKELLVDAGVAYALDDGTLRDRFHGRVMFPIHSLSGKVIAFSGRVMQTNAKTAKYVNSPESDVYTKSNELYGIWLAKAAIVKQDKCYLVEGNTDVVSMHQAGVENVVASCGTSLTTGQIRKIHRFTNNITVIYDGDSAGIHASLRGIDMLLEEGMNVKVVLLPDGEDPDSFARAHSATEFLDYITRHEVDFIRFKVGLLLDAVGDDPFRRAELIKDIERSIAVIPETIVRATYITACSQMLHTDEKILIADVDKIRASFPKKRNQSSSPSQVGGAPIGQPQTARPEGESASEGVPSSPVGENQPVSASSEADAPSSSTPSSAGTAPAGDAAASFAPSLGGIRGEAYPLEPKERLLIQQIIRHGEQVICQDEMDDGSLLDVTVTEFIVDDMRADEIEFSVPLYRRIADEARSLCDAPGYEAARHFLHHEDADVSALAADLIGDRYELSRIYTADNELTYVVPHLINDLKMSIVERDLAAIMQRLRDPAVGADPTLSRQIMEEYKELLTARNKLASLLGARVVTQ